MKSIINIKSLLVASLAMLTLTSCERDFLETDPTTSVSTDLSVATADNMSYVINGMHRNMYVRQNSSQGQNGATGINIFMDVLGEDLIFPTTGNGWFVSMLRWLDPVNANSSNLYYVYNFHYQMIKNANTLINNAEKATGDPVLIERILGEAHAFRGYSYFMLAQVYGKRYVPGTSNTQPGVPLRLDEAFDPIERASVEDVYTQVNKDLAIAADFLQGKARQSKSHFNYNVVKGMMARVALVQGKYPEAAANAKEARQGFPLMSNAAYKQGFNDYANGEWLWGYAIQDDQSDYFGNFMAYMSRNYNSTQIRSAPKVVNKNLFDAFASTDVRTQVIDPTGLHAGLGLPSNYSKFPYTSQKFLSIDNNISLGDVVFMRAAEMYLIEAEALARSGKEAESKVVFALLEKNRNPAYVASAKTGPAYVDEILTSRRLELWGEGFRWLDLKRLGLPLDRTGTNTVDAVTLNLNVVPANHNSWTWLIPQTEINNSKGVVTQNDL